VGFKNPTRGNSRGKEENSGASEGSRRQRQQRKVGEVNGRVLSLSEGWGAGGLLESPLGGEGRTFCGLLEEEISGVGATDEDDRDSPKWAGGEKKDIPRVLE